MQSVVNATTVENGSPHLGGGIIVEYADKYFALDAAAKKYLEKF